MKKVNVFLQDRFETVEALAVIDVLRRAEIEVETISLMEDLHVVSAQGITVLADRMYSGYDFSDTSLYFLPGGPGTLAYMDKKDFLNLIEEACSDGKLIAAICAAPSILGNLGLLEGRRATCFPGFERYLRGAQITDEKVVVDGNIITSRGMGTSIDLGLELVRILISPDKAEEIGKSAQYL